MGIADSAVIDASVVIKWYLPEGAELHKKPAMAILDAFIKGDLTLHAPSILPFEVGNVLARRSPRPREDFDAFLDLPIVCHDADAALHRRTLALRTERDIIYFDAAYLALAEQLGIPLVSDDRELCAAARASGRPLGEWTRRPHRRDP